LTISQSTVDNWKVGQSPVANVGEAIRQFDSMRPDNAGVFQKGATIPGGVIVATNFDVNDSSAWSKYPVTPLIHSGTWGLFQTTSEYKTPSDGACMTIVPG
jgi:hypothetical protein